MIKLSDYVAQWIAGKGIRHVFMVPGGGAMHLNDSIGHCSGLNFVCNLHEQASAIAAEAYAKMTNYFGVAVVTTGPGGTNAITGVAGAWLDSTPCLFISGQVKRADLVGGAGVRQMGVQEVDIVSMVKAITKYAVTVLDPITILYHLEKSLYLARSGRPGPVWIDIPLDVQAAMIDESQLTGLDSQESNGHFDSCQLRAHVARVIELLNNAERPILLAGNGIRLAHAQTEFVKLINLLGIPVMTTWPAMDFLPQDHPLFIGRPGSVAPRGANFALQNSDWLLTIGTRIDMTITGYAPEKLARGARKIMVDIDPFEIKKIADKTTVDVPICADAKIFMQMLQEQSTQIRPRYRSKWTKRCQDWKEQYPVVLPEHRSRSDYISTYYLTEILSEEIAENSVIVPCSSGAGLEIFLLAFKVKAGQRIFYTTALGAMGFGIPAAIGACLANSQRQIVCIDGDGGFQLNIQELETVARLNLPIKFFVLNNQGYSSIRTSQTRYFGRLSGADHTSGLTLPDAGKVASAYGIKAVRLDKTLHLKKQVSEILQMPGPVVCDVVVVPDEPRAPSLASFQRPDGSMISRPLEDLWPFLDRQEFLSNMLVSPVEESYP